MDASTTLSEPMRRALDAMLEGHPAPPDAQAALTDAERQELAALARTAQLTHLSLQKPEPSDAMEMQARERAVDAMTEAGRRNATPLTHGSMSPSAENAADEKGLRGWLNRLLGRKRGK